MTKKLVSSPILAYFPQIRTAIFFLIWLCHSLEIIVSYRHVQCKKKLNDPILRKLSDGRTDGQTDKSDLKVNCPTKVELPKSEKTDATVLRSCVASG